MPSLHTPFIGTAGWSIPAPDKSAFPEQGSHLQRYAGRLDAVEVNSSFYRPHRRETWGRWAEAVPAGFRFSVKLPRTITHDRRLVDCRDLVATFLDQAAGLGPKLGVLLVQLPPSLRFDADAAGDFFAMLQDVTDADIACEPRHRSWFEAAGDDLLVRHRVARVAADPAIVPAAAMPGGWDGLVYHRLHGSPQIYRSAYDGDALARIDRAVRRAPGKVWCIFDNTASGAAMGNALALCDLVGADAELP